jgi:hypothetical protein
MDPFGPQPDTLRATREALHRLSAYVIAPVRHTATGRFGLRSTPGGHGTPEFDGRQCRVEGNELIDEVGGAERRHQIYTLAAAAEFLECSVDAETAAEHDSPEVGDVDESLGIDAASSRYLGAWFEMAFAALHAVAADPESVDASEPQLWPGHFDAAIEVGDEDHRASYGASPGDHAIDEPYLYVSAWWPDKIGLDTTDAFWNAPNFAGSMLKLSDFTTEVDPIDVATNFWRESRNKLG